MQTVVQNLDPIEKYGGASYVCDLYEIAHAGIDWKNHATIQKNRSIKRRFQEHLKQQLNKTAIYPSDQIYQILSENKEQLQQLDQEFCNQSWIKHGDFKIDVSSLQKRILPTGFYSLDRLIGGFGRGNLVILGGRSGMGKTAFVCNMTLQMASAGKKIAFLTLEMTTEEIIMRMVSCNSRKVFIQSQFDADDFSQEFLKTIDLPIYYEEKSRILPKIMQTISELYYKENIDLVVIDYLQFISSNPHEKMESRNLEISYMTSQLKGAAIQYKIPIVCLAQLNRLVESRIDKRPMLSDLRDSGSIEQDADLVMFLYRDDYYNPEKNPGMVECIVAKNRHGNTGKINFRYEKMSGRFE